MRIQSILVAALLLLIPAHAHADVLRDVDPLKESELSQLCGGFTLPNGIDLNVGIDNTVSVNGTVAGSSTLDINGKVISTSSTGTTTVVGHGGVTTIEMPSVGSAFIMNTANNIQLSQNRTITVTINNAAGLLTAHTLSGIQSQVAFGLKTFH